MENEHKHQVRIHIDQKPYESPNPTTGEALYSSAMSSRVIDLFREVRGDKEDPNVRERCGADSPARGRAFPQRPRAATEIHDHRQRPEEGGHNQDCDVRRNRQAGVPDPADRARTSCTPSPTRTARASIRRAR